VSTTWNDSRFGPGSYEHASQEDRSAPRVRVHISANLRPAGGRAFRTTVRDMSLGGFTASAPDRLEQHTFVWLTIPGHEAMQGEVVWWDAGIVGVAFARLLAQDQLDMLAGREEPI
jgi:hypothetical protein